MSGPAAKDTILPHPHRQSKISEISQIALVQPRRNSRVSKLIESQQVRFMIMRAQRTREFGVPGSGFSEFSLLIAPLGPLFGSSASFERERGRSPGDEVKKQWFVINPDTNPFSTAWQIVTNFALAFVALITPLQASFALLWSR